MTDQITRICRVTRNSSFIACCEGVMKEDALKAERGEVTQKYVAYQNNRIQGLLFEFFGDRDIKEIDYALMDDFRTALFRRGLSNSTIKLHFSTLSKVLNYAQRYKLLDIPPVKPQIKQQDNARGFFNLREYLALRRASHRLLGSTHGISQKDDGKKAAGQPLRRVTVTEEILYVIPFMVYSFIRPTDLKTMQHRHIEIRSGAQGDYLYMPIPETKKHDKPITSLPRAAYYYRRLREYQQRRGLGDDEHYLFVPDMENRTYAYRHLTRQFDVLLAALQPLSALPWTLSIAGDLTRDDKAPVQLTHDIESFSFQQRVHALGAVSDTQLDALYQNADVFVLASLFDGYGMAYAEALARGLPVIGTTGGAIPDTVPQEAGLLVPPGDVPHLTQALRAVMLDKNLRERLSQGAKRAALQQPTWEQSVKRFAEVLEPLQTQL